MKLRFVMILILLVLFTILVIQNSASTLFLVFLWNFSAPLSLLVVITGVLGIILGIIIGKMLDSRKEKTEELKTTGDKSEEIKQDNPDFTDSRFKNPKK